MMFFSKILLLTTILFSSLLSATTIEEWQIKKNNNYGYDIQHRTNNNINTTIETDGMGTPELTKIISVKNKPHIQLIEYMSGVVGTSEVTQHFRVIIYNTKTKTIIGNGVLYKYLINNGTKIITKKTKWVFDGDKLTIYYENGKPDIININKD